VFAWGLSSGKVTPVSALDIARFKDALGHFATGVVVVSASTPEGPKGFAAQTFLSLSLEPMLVGFAATIGTSSWPAIREVGKVGISVLRDDQEPLARVFGRSGADKFEGVGTETAENGAPLLQGALAHIEGDIISVTPHGDHEIAIVAVTHVESHDGRPLVFYRGGFTCLT
jgi:3-hydroxy-9,10-secoandrosta-1,3,5(10)-triene-9,17-dione monooxygenase reductase component